MKRIDKPLTKALTERRLDTVPFATHYCRECLSFFDLSTTPRGVTFTVECCSKPFLVKIDHPAVDEKLKGRP